MNEVLEALAAGRFARYRKRPVVVEAYRTELGLDIATLEGVMRASPGDFVIRGVKGELYPCKPDIFAATYEPVDGPAVEPPAPRPGFRARPGAYALFLTEHDEGAD